MLEKPLTFMLTEFAGRRVILTTLDPIPSLFRAAPGCIAVSSVEARALAAGDGETFKHLISICSMEDDLDLRRRRRPEPKIRRGRSRVRRKAAT